jgi:hypothetical protein
MLLGREEARTLSGGHIVGMQDSPLASPQSLRPSQIADVRLAASTMTGPTRRAFQAERALKYCGGTPLLAETIFGWGRHTVEGGWPNDAQGSCVSGRQRPAAAANAGKTHLPRPQQPCPGWRKRTRNKPQHFAPPGLYATDGASGSGSLESSRVGYGPMALAQYDGRGTGPEGISAAPSGESQATKEDR